MASTTATFFSVYTTTIGTTTVRPLVRFGSAPTGDHALQELDANEVIVTSATFTPDLDADQTVNYDQTTGVFSVGAVAKDNSQLSDEGEQELNRLRDLSRDLVSADMNEVLTDRQRSKIRAYRRALKNLPYSRTWPTTVSYPTAPSSPEPAAPVPFYQLNVGEPANRAVSVTRAGAVAKRFNESGIMETVSADTPRFDYDPVTRDIKGLLVQQAATNLCLQSDSIGTNPWSLLGATGTLTQRRPHERHKAGP